jgi:hypothetical protein
MYSLRPIKNASLAFEKKITQRVQSLKKIDLITYLIK